MRQAANRGCARRLAGSRGGAMLEFALCTPILLYLLVAVSDFSRYYVEVSRVGQAAWSAAQTAAAGSERFQAASPSISVETETYCSCPLRPDVRLACGERSCGAYGEPARYALASATKPFSFMGRYPGIPRLLQIRRTAGVRAH